MSEGVLKNVPVVGRMRLGDDGKWRMVEEGTTYADVPVDGLAEKFMRAFIRDQEAGGAD